MTTPLNPESRTPTPRLALPPTPRDFEIHRLSSIELLSTRKIAGQFKISQTRVRQIVEDVSRWLAEKLPFASDLELEREKRLALHLAAAQLRHQAEQLQELWTDSKDTKYLRQQTRCILALARLGVIPGTLEALAADAEHQPEAQARDSIPERSAAATDAPSTSPVPKSEICNPKSEIPPPPSSSFVLSPSSFPPPPPSEDCSPKPVPIPKPAATPEPAPAPTPLQPIPCDEDFIPEDADLNDLNVIEQYLLTQLDRSPSDKPKHREVVNQALATVRHKRACFVLELTPNAPAALTIPKDSPTSAPCLTQLTTDK